MYNFYVLAVPRSSQSERSICFVRGELIVVHYMTSAECFFAPKAVNCYFTVTRRQLPGAGIHVWCPGALTASFAMDQCARKEGLGARVGYDKFVINRLVRKTIQRSPCPVGIGPRARCVVLEEGVFCVTQKPGDSIAHDHSPVDLGCMLLVFKSNALDFPCSHRFHKCGRAILLFQQEKCFFWRMACNILHQVGFLHLP